MSKEAPIHVVIAALERQGRRFKHHGDQVDAQCPAHDDHAPSLSVTYNRTTGKVLVNCHVGCAPDEVIAALDLTWSDLFDTESEDQDRVRRPEIVATYDYADEHGEVVFQKVRYAPKDFRVRRPDGRGGWTWKLGDTRRVLYRLPELRAAVAAGKTVLIAEGEKDADRAVAELGVAATTNFEGAAKEGQRPKWRREYAEQLRGATRVIIVADNDPAGYAHAAAVHASLVGVVGQVGIFRAAVDEPKADLSDHLDAGHRLDHLALVDQTADTSDGNQADSGRSVLVTLSTVQPERLEWLWQGRLPAGKLVTLDGDPSLGKSTLGVTFAAHVSTGKPWPDGEHCIAGDVVILSAEDGLADTIRPRLDAAGGDPERVHALTAVREVNASGSITTRPPTLADVTAIREVVEQTGARLLIVDVLMAYLPGKVDAHRDQDVRGVLHRIAELADATGCTMLLLRHLNKSSGGSPMYRGGGSIGIVGAARAGFLVALDPEDETETVRVLACVKSNLAAMPNSLSYRLVSAPGRDVAHIEWIGASTHRAADLLRTDTDEQGERDDAAAFIHDFLTEAGGSALARDVQDAGRKRGYSKTTMHRAAQKLRVVKEKDGMRGPWTWRHPDDCPEGSTEGSEDPTSQEPEPSEPSWNLHEPDEPAEPAPDPERCCRWCSRPLPAGTPDDVIGHLECRPAKAA